jgi:hypothetical protein
MIMEQIYCTIAIIVYAIFIIRFILSWFGSDFDFDDDLDVGDVVSFKGLTHFLMGSTGWLSLKSIITHNIQWWDYLIALGLGILFVIILFYIYKLMCKLENKPIISTGKNLIGKSATIYLLSGSALSFTYKYVITVSTEFGTFDVLAVSNYEYSVGDKVTIKDYSNSYYII